MLVSVIIPAFRAHTTIARAVQSALVQTWRDLEVVIVADDDADYRAVLADNSVADSRLRFAATGKIGSGCHNARNAGLAVAQGDFIAALDADDVFLPARLATLLPIAQRDGAASDNPRVVSDVTGQDLYCALDGVASRRLGIADLLALSTPLFPLVAREHAQPRLPGIEFGEDFVANLRLIDRLGGLPVIDETLSEYHVVTGSLAHSDRSAEQFEHSYTALIDRVERGDRLGLSAAGALAARNGLVKKRAFNRAFAAAQKIEPGLDFQGFAARIGKGTVSPP